MKRRTITRLCLTLAVALLAVSGARAAELTPEERAALQPQVEAQVEAPQEDVRRLAVLTLGLLLEADALRGYQEAYAEHADGLTRRAAMVVLARRDVRGADAALREVIEGVEADKLEALLREVVEPLDVASRVELYERLIARPASPEARVVAARYIAKHGAGEELATLRGLLKVREASERVAAAQELVKAPREALLGMAEALLEARDVETRGVGLDLALAIDTVEGRRLAAGALEDADEGLRARAEQALRARQHPSVLPILEARLREDPRDAETLAALLAYEPTGLDGVLLPLVEGSAPSLDQATYNQIMALLAAGKSPQIKALIRTKLGTAHEPDRVAATHAIRYTQDAGFLTELTGLIVDGSLEVRRAAARALGALGDPAALQIIERGLRENQDREVRLSLLRAIGELGAAQGVQQLQFHIMDSDSEMRLAAIEALGQLGTAAAAPALEMLAQDPDPTVRWRTALALYRLDPAANTGRLRAAVESAPEEGFMEALEALAPETRLELEKAVIGSRRLALAQGIVDAASGSRRPEDLERLRYAHDNAANRAVWTKAFEALAALGLPEDLERLVADTTHEQRAVRVHALRALLAYPPTDTRAAFEAAAADPDALIQALGRYGLVQ